MSDGHTGGAFLHLVSPADEKLKIYEQAKLCRHINYSKTHTRKRRKKFWTQYVYINSSFFYGYKNIARNY